MKLDCIQPNEPEPPIIRLYEFTPQEAADLKAICESLATGVLPFAKIHELPWVQAIGDCRLTLVVRSWDQSSVQIAEDAYECGFTKEVWGDVACLIEPFLQSEAKGFQWLAGMPGEAVLLLSVSGKW